MSPTTPKAGAPCQVCGSADPSLTLCGGCAASARRLVQPPSIPFAPPPRDPRLGPCSFCSAESPDLRAMFVGPDIYGEPVRVCDQCLDLCCDIITERRSEAAAGFAPTVPPPASPSPGAPGTPDDEGPDPVVTLADGTPLDDARILETLEMTPFGVPEKPAAVSEKPGRTLLDMPAATVAGERWLAPKATIECPACKHVRPASSLVACCTTCFARARAPAEVVITVGPEIFPVPAPTLPHPPPGGEFACSFCHRPRSLVRGLVSGPRVFICESCITDFAVALEPRYWWAWERPVRTG